jgi:hypothetical protein
MSALRFMLLMILALSAAPAAAIDSPYFDRRQICRMEDGSRLRLLYGDGLLGPDPLAAVVVNPEGRLLAYHSLSPGSYLLPKAPCRAFDPERGQAFAPDHHSQEPGDLIEGGSEAARQARWALEPGFETVSFGFREVPLSPLQRVAYSVAGIWQKQAAVIFVMIPCLAALACLWGAGRQAFRSGPRLQRAAIATLCLAGVWLSGYGVLAAVIVAAATWHIPAAALLGSLLLLMAGAALARFVRRSLAMRR